MTQASPSLDATLTALADPYRRRAVELLVQRPRRAGELAAELGLPAPAMSRHLRVLRQTGLVEETHPGFDARVRIYSLVPAPMQELKAWLQQAEEAWATQLQAFKAHIEAQGGESEQTWTESSQIDDAGQGQGRRDG